MTNIPNIVDEFLSITLAQTIKYRQIFEKQKVKNRLIQHIFEIDYPEPTAVIQPKPKLVKEPKPIKLPKAIIVNPVKLLKKQQAAYKALVWKLTKQNDLSSLPNIEKRRFREYDLDHIISVYEGFKKNIKPEIIAGIDNLRIIPHRINWKKGAKSHYNAHPLAGLFIQF